MALVQCRECGRGVSSEADSCPQCGCRMRSQPQPQSQSKGVQTIELTGKRWKAYGCLGAILPVGGFVTMMANQDDTSGTPFLLGVLAIVLGLVLAVVARLGKWWYHE